MNENFRIETDTMGDVKVPIAKYWGAQTQRSINNFKIGEMASMPIEIIYGFAYLKKSAAHTNYKLGVLSEEKKNLISLACDEILAGDHDDQFPLVTWQTETRADRRYRQSNFCHFCQIGSFSSKKFALSCISISFFSKVINIFDFFPRGDGGDWLICSLGFFLFVRCFRLFFLCHMRV